jgi:hypothetical protein
VNKKDILFYLLILLIICLGIYLIKYVHSESYECMNDPLVYGVSKYKADVGYFYCDCSSGGINHLIVTDKGKTITDYSDVDTFRG